MDGSYATLKTECLHQLPLASLADTQAHVFDYLEVFYNREQLHSALGYKSPVDLEQQIH